MPRIGLGFGLKNNNKSASLVLDQFAGSVAAYSLRYLSSSYMGDVILVRRSSDNAQLGFTPTEITDGTLTSWVGASNGSIRVWYDQSGNSNNLDEVDLSRQPIIVSSGNLLTDVEGNPHVLFSGGKHIGTSGQLLSSDPWSIFTVMTPDEITINETAEVIVAQHFGLGDLGRSVFQQIRRLTGSNGYATFYNNGSSFTGIHSTSMTLNKVLFTSIHDGTDAFIGIDSNLEEVISGEDVTLLNTSFSVGAYSDNLHTSALNGKIQEIIVYDSDQSANRSAIETAINSYYSIY